jgi:hypothetical protein
LSPPTPTPFKGLPLSEKGALEVFKFDLKLLKPHHLTFQILHPLLQQQPSKKNRSMMLARPTQWSVEKWL